MGRELTRTEKAAIRRLVSKWCANYDRDCGCLPLDCECYMFGNCKEHFKKCFRYLHL